ncbi:MAG: thioredoxin family protein, partial [Deltaproteobacteria bacterium]|nr:thioredoxin family protein [Deltaproteobacteria bacterium]
PALSAMALGAVVLVVAVAAGGYLLLAPAEPPPVPVAAPSPGDLHVLEKEAAELGCPRRIKAPETIEEKAAADPLPADWLNDAAGWTRATAPDRDPGAPMVVYFGVPWCKYAKAFERDVLADATVRAALRDHVRVRINPEAGDTESRLADDFGVKVYPTVVHVDSEGNRRKIAVLRDVGTEVMLGKAEDFAGAVGQR